MAGLLQEVKTTRVSNAVAAGTSTINATGVSQVGFKHIQFEVHFGTITTNAVTSVEIHESSDDGSTDAYTAVADSNVSVADDKDNKIVIIELLDTQEKWYRVVVNRATQNAVVDTIVCHQSGATAVPITDSSTTLGNLQLQSAIAGTA